MSNPPPTDDEDDDDCDLEPETRFNLAFLWYRKQNRKRKLDSSIECKAPDTTTTVADASTDTAVKKEESGHDVLLIDMKPPLKRRRSELDVNCAESRPCGVQTNEHHWRVQPGLNYYGIPIHSADCDAFGERVCVHRGFGHVDVMNEEEMRKCPTCNAPFAFMGVFIFECRAVVKYQIGDDDAVTTNTFCAIDGNCVDFGHHEKLEALTTTTTDAQHEEIGSAAGKHESSNGAAVDGNTHTSNESPSTESSLSTPQMEAECKREEKDYRLVKYRMLQFEVKPIVSKPPPSALTMPSDSNKNSGKLSQLQPGVYRSDTVMSRIAHRNRNLCMLLNHATYNGSARQSDSITLVPLDLDLDHINAEDQQKLQMARSILQVYAGALTIDKIMKLSFDRVKALHAEIVQKVMHGNASSFCPY